MVLFLTMLNFNSLSSYRRWLFPVLLGNAKNLSMAVWCAGGPGGTVLVPAAVTCTVGWVPQVTKQPSTDLMAAVLEQDFVFVSLDTKGWARPGSAPCGPAEGFSLLMSKTLLCSSGHLTSLGAECRYFRSTVHENPSAALNGAGNWLTPPGQRSRLFAAQAPDADSCPR